MRPTRLEMPPWPQSHAIVITDRTGCISSWDAGATALFGHAAEDVMGRSVDVLVPEHLRAAHWTGFHRAMTAPVIRNLAADLPVVCSDGEVRHFAGRLLVIIDGLGVALGAMGDLQRWLDRGSTLRVTIQGGEVRHAVVQVADCPASSSRSKRPLARARQASRIRSTRRLRSSAGRRTSTDAWPS